MLKHVSYIYYNTKNFIHQVLLSPWPKHPLGRPIQIQFPSLFLEYVRLSPMPAITSGPGACTTT